MTLASSLRLCGRASWLVVASALATGGTMSTACTSSSSSLVSMVSGNSVTSCAAVDVDTIEHRYRAFGDDSAPLPIDRFPCDNTVAGTLYALSHGTEVGSAETSLFVMDGNRVTDHASTLDIDGH